MGGAALVPASTASPGATASKGDGEDTIDGDGADDKVSDLGATGINHLSGGDGDDAISVDSVASDSSTAA